MPGACPAEFARRILLSNRVRYDGRYKMDGEPRQTYLNSLMKFHICDSAHDAVPNYEVVPRCLARGLGGNGVEEASMPGVEGGKIKKLYMQVSKFL